MSEELKPCPFCGGAPIESAKFPGYRSIWCSNQPDGCDNRSMYTREGWNRRAPITLDQAKQVLADAGMVAVPETVELENGLIAVRTGGMDRSAEYVIKAAQENPDA